VSRKADPRERTALKSTNNLRSFQEKKKKNNPHIIIIIIIVSSQSTKLQHEQNRTFLIALHPIPQVRTITTEIKSNPSTFPAALP
jgi:hypothetical protein